MNEKVEEKMQLSKLLDKAKHKSFLSFEEGMALYDMPLLELGQLAAFLKEERFGKKISYIRNYYINLTNICMYACNYCGFRRNKTDKDAYTLSLEQIEHKLLNAPEKISEVWFSSGLNKDLPYEYYIDLIKLVKRTLKDVHLKAFTAVEIDFFSKHFYKSHEQIIDDFMSVGLDRIPAGGAEIFDDQIRKKIDVKTRPEDYLKIHNICHKKDMQTSITMLFGHVEQREHRIKHMLRVRDFQEVSKGVQAFIPLAFQDKNNPLAKKGIKSPFAVEILKTLAISRILVPNVDHIQSFWVDSGEDVTQISMSFGIDDINGTLIEENIAHESGSKTKKYQSSSELIAWIEASGYEAVERDCLFRTINCS